MPCCNDRRARVAGLLVMLAVAAGAAEAPKARPTFHASIVSASEAAAADESLVLVTLGGDWCPPCASMRRQVLNSREFLEQAGALRIAEIDVQANPKAAEDFAATSFPTLVLMTAEGKIVARDTGTKDIVQLLAWIASGRDRARRGLWEGTAPGAALNEFITRAAADRLTGQDLRQLAVLLGASDPGERVAAAKMLAGQREQAMPALLDALTDRYLGVRIGASELLRKLAPAAPAIDPWQAPEELAAAVAALKEWWAKAGKLPAVTETAAVDPSLKTSIVAALESLRSPDAARRTEGMSALAAFGPSALPSIREAIKRHEKTGDLRAVALLEDVRWAILVPDPVEQRAQVRAALARGASPERQAAALRLGNAGREALDALGELAADHDPLVVENAVRALSNVGGRDAIPAMAALLKAGDANLRMTAAQALGRSKSPDAVKPLLAVVGDPNEVVASTALAALEQVCANGASAGFSDSRAKRDPEIVGGLKRALGDSRWRVRATAAEVAARLHATELAAELKALLADPDGFVVKNALAALQAIGSAPEPAQLAGIARRLPALRAEAVRALAKSPAEDAATVATGIFEAAEPGEQAMLLRALAERERFDTSTLDPSWQSLIARAAASTQADVRRAGAALIGRVPPRAAVPLVAPLLGDRDDEVRSLAALSALELLSGKRARSDGDTTVALIEESESLATPSARGNTNEPLVSATVRREWQQALSVAPPGEDVLVAAARFATAEQAPDVRPLIAALEAMEAAAARRLALSPAPALIVARLRWPEGEPVLHAFARSPLAFATAVTASREATNAVRDFLLDPARFAQAVAPARDEALEFALTSLLSRRKAEWSLLDGSPAARAIARQLADSTNAAWRAAGVYALGRMADPAAVEIAIRAGKDAHAGVRQAAVQTLARVTKDRAALERQLGPFLSETNEPVAAMAACALLEPEVRDAAMLGWSFEMFQFENVRAGMMDHTRDDSERPLAVLDTKPAYLPAARDWLRRDGKGRPAFALLLAQHGDVSGVDALAADAGAKDAEATVALLTAIGLSKDSRHLPVVRRVLDGMTQPHEWQQVLRALKGMGGPEARQLRLEINKRMRASAQ